VNGVTDLTPFLPLIGLGATAILLMGLASIRRHATAAFILTLIGLGVSFALLVATNGRGPAGSMLLVADSYTRLFVGLIMLITLCVTLLSRGYFGETLAPGRDTHAEEYLMLLVLAALGASVLVSARHFVTLFLGLELLSVSLYGLIAFTRREPGVEAAIKYLVLAGVSSAFLLFGIALLYARTGTLELARLGAVLAGTSVHRHAAVAAADPIVLAGVGLLIVGFGFKLGVVPFHMWTPDVYQGAPAPVTAFLATASKGAVAAVLLRYANALGFVRGGPLWMLLALVAVASMFAGNLLALRQSHLKRLLAYSSIAHLGYILLALLAGGTAAARAVVFYLIAYSVTTLGAFGGIAVLSNRAPAREGAAGGDDLDDLAAYRGLGRRRPWLAGVLAASLLSLAGIPLTAGFIGKFLVFTAGAAASLWTLIVVLAVNSAIGIYYYLRVIVTIYLAPVEAEASAEPPPPRVALSGGIALAVLLLALLWLGIAPGALLRLVVGSFHGML
jgi:NADH-quinone oxidoreductase subunit N